MDANGTTHDTARESVVLPDQAAEDRAKAILQRCGGSAVHVHTIEREWGVADVPLHDAQPDPFLIRETSWRAPVLLCR